MSPNDQKTYTNIEGTPMTLTELAKKYGINRDTLLYRLNKGMSIEDAVSASVESTYSSITDPVSGETHSLKEWSNILNINYSTLVLRIKSGLPIEEVFYCEKNKTHKEDTKYKQRVYPSMDLTGRKFGMLTVIKRCDSKRDGEREWRWVCECDCEDHNIVEVIQHNLLNGHCSSCGCASKTKPKDMTGMKCGHLTVLEEVKDKSEVPENMRGLGVLWRCECDCEDHNIVIVPGSYLRTKKNISCGCQAINKVDGESKSKIYVVYKDMVQRCTNKNEPAYKDYGARGITVCKDWMPRLVDGRNVGYFNFKDWALANGYVEGLSLDREDNSKGYSPDNCRFVTMKVQNNNRRSNRLIEYKGETKTSTEWAEYFGIHPVTFRNRLDRGMSVEEAIETPVMERKTIVSSTGEAHTESEWSRISGVNRTTLHRRIYIRNMDVDRAITEGATNPEIYNHVYPASVYAMQHPGYIAPPIPPAMYYVDILGRYYTPEEWDAHQAIFFDD